jgi:hypothetical protein
MGFIVVRIMESGDNALFLFGAWYDGVVGMANGSRFRGRVLVRDSIRGDTLVCRAHRACRERVGRR